MQTIVELNARRVTGMTYARCVEVCRANNESDSEVDYRAEYRVGQWYCAVYDKATGDKLGIL